VKLLLMKALFPSWRRQQYVSKKSYMPTGVHKIHTTASTLLVEWATEATYGFDGYSACMYRWQLNSKLTDLLLHVEKVVNRADDGLYAELCIVNGDQDCNAFSWLRLGRWIKINMCIISSRVLTSALLIQTDG
jgi:hypothetical protein